MATRKKSQPDNSAVVGVIYARFSSHNQREESIEQQVAECTAFAKANGITIAKVYADKAISGKTDKRTEFQHMMRDAEKGLFKVVVAYKSNRIARNMLNALQYENKLEAFGIRTVYAKEQFGDNAAGRFALRMFMNINQFYSENMGEDIRRGLRDNAQNLKVGSSLAYGYKKGDDGRYAVNEDEAPIVREIFGKVADGIPFIEIINSLNARNITTRRGTPFNKNSFHRMLENERYIGVYDYCGVRVENGVPPIISKEVFYTVQKVLKDGKEDVKRRANAEFLLTGKLYCGECGSPMTGISGTGKSGAMHYYYQCRNKRAGGECEKQNVVRDWLEQLVISMTQECISNADVTHWIIDGYIAMKKQAKENSDLPIMETELAERKKALANIMKAIEAGVFNNTTAARMKELETEIHDLEQSISVGNAMFEEKVDGELLESYLEKLANGEVENKAYRKELINTFVKSVRLWNDRIEIEYNFTGTDGNGFQSHRVLNDYLHGVSSDTGGSSTLPVSPLSESQTNPCCKIINTADGNKIILSITYFGFAARAYLPK